MSSGIRDVKVNRFWLLSVVEEKVGFFAVASREVPRYEFRRKTQLSHQSLAKLVFHLTGHIQSALAGIRSFSSGYLERVL